MIIIFKEIKVVLFTLFKKEKPKVGDKVTFSDKAIKEHGLSEFAQKHVFIVKEVYSKRAIKLNVGTVMYAGEWKILPKETPPHH